jgi:uncharacterized protein YqfA (UPF0365 family)
VKWLSALTSSLPLSFRLPSGQRQFIPSMGLALVKMQWMRIRIYAPESIYPFVRARHFSSGVNVSIERLEMHFLAGANVSPINYTLTATSKAATQQMYQAFASEELSGRRKLELKKSI